MTIEPVHTAADVFSILVRKETGKAPPPIQRLPLRPVGYEDFMPAEQASDILEALKRVAAGLRDAELPFCVGGGLAAWARGGPPPSMTSTS